MDKYISITSKIFIFILIFLPTITFAKKSIVKNVKINQLKNSETIIIEDKENQKWKEDLKKAYDYYDNKKYDKALKIFDEIIPLMIFTGEIVDARFKQANCSFYEGEYEASVYQFSEFHNDYENIVSAQSQVETALYMHGLSMSKLSKSIHLNQYHTEEAVQIFKEYLKKYPNGKHLKEVEIALQEMLCKLFKKELYIVDTYYKIEAYDSAKIWLNSIIESAPTDELLEQANWLKLKILYEIGKENYEWPKLIESEEFCKQFIFSYPKSKHIKTAKNFYGKVKHITK